MRVITSDEIIMSRLHIAQDFAKSASGCLKVSVGSVVFKNDVLVALGANRAMPNLCRGTRGCLRIEKYGNNSKEHRNPSDCRAIHSEIDAIATSSNLNGGIMYVTRYPCEACARAIVSAGIQKVWYGREQVISEETYNIFKENHVEVHNFSSFKEDDVVE